MRTYLLTFDNRWGDRGMGGFYWSTYKALCHRAGVFANGQGSHDLNAQLSAPIMKGLATNWEKAFARRLPSVLVEFTKRSKALLLHFHKEVEARCMKLGLGLAGLSMLGHQLRNYEAIFVDLTAVVSEVITKQQREANRDFTPSIAFALADTYEWCAAEKGKGKLYYLMRCKTPS